MDGGMISVNAQDSSKFDISAGEGHVVDNTDPLSPLVTPVSWDEMLGVSIEDLGDGGITGRPATFLSINRNKQIVQEALPPDAASNRQNIHLGSVTHIGVTIEAFSNFTSARPIDLAVMITEFFDALGPVHIGGNTWAGKSGTLQLEADAGKFFFPGFNRDPVNPNVKDTPALDAPAFIATWRDGTETNGQPNWHVEFENALFAGRYDDDTVGPYTNGPNGVLSTNFWTNHRIQYSPDSGSTVVTYGQTTYNSLDDALAGIKNEGFVGNPAAALIPYRAVLTMRGGALDLALAGDAMFTPAGKIGEF